MNQAEAIERFRSDRWLAHQFFFARRHDEQSCEAHAELVRGIHDDEPRRSIEGFRGLGKTTYLEEAAVLRACFAEFRYMVVVSANYDPLAIQRLAAIKREFEINDNIERVFGRLKGSIWQEGRIQLSNGVAIQAIGRDMSVTGLKWLDTRPDALLIDDVEDPEKPLNDIERTVMWEWLLKTLLPATSDPINSWIRALGTRRGKGSLPERLENHGWPTLKFPIEHLDESGRRVATWPGKFPIQKIDALRWLYRGDMHLYAQEYMCQAVSDEARIFREHTFRTVTRTRTWEAVYAMYDPARTVGSRSATTGKAVWSWVNGRLVIWQASANRWMPSDLVADIFATHEEFDPVWIGVEEDGLNEWVREPIRRAQLERGISVPLKPMRAPKGKTDFIRSLQIYFDAGEVEFACEAPDLKAQLLSFPHPPIDAPNALAYALTMRPGLPIYENFTDEHVVLDLRSSPWKPLHLAGNARDGWVTAVLMQFYDGRIKVLADWAVEGSPEERAADIDREAALAGEHLRMRQPIPVRGLDALKSTDVEPAIIRSRPSWLVPAWHWDRWLNVGLVQALKRVPAEVMRGGEIEAGRNYLGDLLSRTAHGLSAVEVSENARWTLRAMSGGYCRGKGGIEPEVGPYRCLMEGVESLIGSLALGTEETDIIPPNYAYDRNGRRYVSMRPARRMH